MNERFAQLHAPIQARRSGRAFAKTPLSPDDVALLLEAARWAESCFNLQPWRYVAVTQPDELEALQGALAGGNAWAKAAPLLLAVVTREDLDKTTEDGRRYDLFDTGLSVQNLVLQAVSMGLNCHLMAGFNPDKARQALNIPEDFTVICLVAVGYPGDPATLADDELRQREAAPRERKPLEHIASFERWDERLG